jgi:hypothetical protein
VPAGVHADDVLQPFLLEPDRHFVRRHHLSAARARHRHRVGGVIAVPVRDEHEIERAELPRRLGTGRISRHPGIDDDSLSAG